MPRVAAEGCDGLRTAFQAPWREALAPFGPLACSDGLGAVLDPALS